MIITIARQHGSSGREIARALSEALGIQCFDKEIVDEAAENSSICKELISSFDEKRVSPFMLQTTQYPSMNYGLGLNIQVASAQFDVIRKLADQGDCIFVGRCADYILRERKDLTRVFIMGEQEDKIRCIMNRQNVSETEAKKKIKQVDKDRSSYYKYYTDQIWGESENYDLCINSSKIGVAGAVNVIKAYIENNK
ncbi:MAG: cytidylate kinase-like family protein [Oscillospiraceae bacterium]|nr:cytidylate kinase-like family protein [Oscillospiraceae bacterium]